jgi:hypothetical protein
MTPRELKEEPVENTPFVAEDARIVDENGHTAEGIECGLDNGLALGRGVSIYDRLSSS